MTTLWPARQSSRASGSWIARTGCYLTHYRDTRLFKTIDLSKLNIEAAQIKFLVDDLPRVASAGSDLPWANFRSAFSASSSRQFATVRGPFLSFAARAGWFLH